jgi:hypothetical protein
MNFNSCTLPSNTKSLNNVTRNVNTQPDMQNETCFLKFRRFSMTIGSFTTNWWHYGLTAPLSGAMFSYCHVSNQPCKTSCDVTISPFLKSFISSLCAWHSHGCSMCSLFPFSFDNIVKSPCQHVIIA